MEKNQKQQERGRRKLPINFRSKENPAQNCFSSSRRHHPVLVSAAKKLVRFRCRPKRTSLIPVKLAERFSQLTDTPGKKNQKPRCSAEHQYYGGHLLVIFPPLCWLQESYSPAQHLSPCALLLRHISPLKTAQEEPRQKNQRESSKKVAPGWTEPTYTLNNCALLSASNAGWRRLCSTYPSSAGHVAQALGLTRKLFCSYTSFAIRPPWQRTRAPLAGGFQAGETKHFLITVAEEGWI